MAPASRRSGLGSGVAGDGRRDRRARGARVADVGTGDRYESGYLLQRGRCAVPGANSGGKERAKSGANVTDARTPWCMRAFCPAEPLLRPGARASPPGRRQGGRVAGHMCSERRSWRRSEGGAGEHCARAERSGARARLGRCMWEGHLSGRRAVAAPSTPLRRRRGTGGPRSGATAFECEQLGRSPRGPTLRFYEKRTKGVVFFLSFISVSSLRRAPPLPSKPEYKAPLRERCADAGRLII